MKKKEEEGDWEGRKKTTCPSTHVVEYGPRYTTHTHNKRLLIIVVRKKETYTGSVQGAIESERERERGNTCVVCGLSVRCTYSTHCVVCLPRLFRLTCLSFAIEHYTAIHTHIFLHAPARAIVRHVIINNRLACVPWASFHCVSVLSLSPSMCVCVCELALRVRLSARLCLLHEYVCVCVCLSGCMRAKWQKREHKKHFVWMKEKACGTSRMNTNEMG